MDRSKDYLGGGVVFEVQQNSDVTFRLYDWDHIDPKTGQSRAPQVDQALACIDFAQGAVGPVILHRPLFPGTRQEETVKHPATRMVDIDHESIWISYCPMVLDG